MSRNGLGRDRDHDKREPGFLAPHVSIPLTFEGDVDRLEDDKAVVSIRISVRAVIGWALLLNFLMIPIVDFLRALMFNVF